MDSGCNGTCDSGLVCDDSNRCVARGNYASPPAQPSCQQLSAESPCGPGLVPLCDDTLAYGALEPIWNGACSLYEDSLVGGSLYCCDHSIPSCFYVSSDCPEPTTGVLCYGASTPMNSVDPLECALTTVDGPATESCCAWGNECFAATPTVRDCPSDEDEYFCVGSALPSADCAAISSTGAPSSGAAPGFCCPHDDTDAATGGD